MFEKLLSALPYNPTLVYQLRFYANRMREEAAIRRTGLVFLVLAFFVQFFAVVSPPVATVADSPNDLIDGGFSTQAEAVRDCEGAVPHYKEILSFYGISCNDVANASIETINSTDHDDNLYSAGFKSLGSTYNGKKTGEFCETDIPNVHQVCWRKLSVWDTAGPSPYTVLHIKGTSFYLMYRCGNLVHVGVPRPAPKPPVHVTPPPPPCPQDKNIPATSSKCKACAWDTSILKSNKQCVQCTNPNHPGVTQSSPKCVPVCQYNKYLDRSSPQCKPCTASISSQDKTACMQLHKTASDTTQGWSDANNRTAQPGDTIVYHLYAKNGGKATLNNFTMEENVSDVLDYADVVNTNGGTFEPAVGEVVWKATSIKAGATLTHTITVKVLDPVPQTPASTSDPSRYDLVMTNTYGNTININLPGSPTKTIETASAALPNTGPGSSIAIAAAIVVVAGYFFARARLLASETVLAVRNSANYGGF